MPDFYILSANLPESWQFIEGAADRNAAITQACAQAGITAGKLAVIKADAVKYVNVESANSIQVTDA